MSNGMQLYHTSASTLLNYTTKGYCFEGLANPVKNIASLEYLLKILFRFANIREIYGLKYIRSLDYVLETITFYDSKI